MAAGFGDRLEQPRTPGPGTYSWSALGHRGLSEFLSRRGWRVLARRGTEEAAPGPQAALILAESWLEEGPEGAGKSWAKLVEEAQERGAPLMVVLSKRIGVAQNRKPHWVALTYPIPLDGMENLARAALGKEWGTIHLRREAKTMRGKCQLAPERSLQVDLENPQFIEPLAGAEPLLECEGKWLIARKVRAPEDPPILVVADPDLMNNHGLGRGDHAVVVDEIFRRQIGTPVLIFDESIHGFSRSSSVLAEMMRFPLVVILTQGVLVGLLAVWAGAAGFGKPLPESPPLGRGPRMLIENTAALLNLKENPTGSLTRYWTQSLHAVAERCFLPPDLPEAALVDRLSELTLRRKGSADLRALQAQIRHLSLRRSPPSDQAIRLALRLHAWRQEMRNGPGRHS